MLIANLSRGLEITIRRDNDASLALNGLNNECGGLIVDNFSQSFGIAVVDKDGTRHERLKFLAILLSTCDTQGTDCLAMVATVGRDYFRLSGGGFGEFEGRFDSFGSTVREEADLEIARRHVRQLFGKIRGVFAKECLPAERNMIELILNRLNDPGITMPKGKAAISAEAIEVFPTFVVDDVASFSDHFNAETGEAHESSEVRVDVLCVFVIHILVQRIRVHTASIRGNWVVSFG